MANHETYVPFKTQKKHKKCNTGGGGIVRGRDRMVVGFTTNCAIDAYDH
jgi:hypothetical protein